jgi:hypothetical protein
MLLVGETITQNVFVGTTGLLNTDWNKFLFLDGTLAQEPVSVNESVVSEFYNVSFTPESAGVYSLHVERVSGPASRQSMFFVVDEADPVIKSISVIRSILTRLEDLLRRLIRDAT